MRPTYSENPKTGGEALEDKVMWRKRGKGTSKAPDRRVKKPS